MSWAFHAPIHSRSNSAISPAEASGDVIVRSMCAIMLANGLRVFDRINLHRLNVVDGLAHVAQRGVHGMGQRLHLGRLKFSRHDQALAVGLGQICSHRIHPFLLLSVVVSLEAIFLSTFVLIKQNRMSKRSEQRAHIDLQINLLAEREMTLVLQILQGISASLGVNAPKEQIEEFVEETSVEAVAEELREKLPEE